MLVFNIQLWFFLTRPGDFGMMWRSRSRSRVQILSSRARVPRRQSREHGLASAGRFREETEGAAREDGNGWSRSGKIEFDRDRGFTGVQSRRDPEFEVQRRWGRDGRRSLGGQDGRYFSGKGENPSPERRAGGGGGSLQRLALHRNRGEDGDRPWSRHHGGQATLLIRNLQRTVSPVWLRGTFEQFGHVVDVYLPRNVYNGERRDFGFVKFQNSEAAREARAGMNQEVIGGREVHISIIDDHRKSPQGGLVSDERNGLASRRGNRGQNLIYPHPSATAGRYVRQVLRLPSQNINEHVRVTGAEEEGWTMVGRRRESGLRQTANGGYGGQNGYKGIGERGRGMQRTPGQRDVCFRCLGRGHYKDECRDPIVCRKCRGVGHYEATCQMVAIRCKEDRGSYKGVEKDLPRVACLVGEIEEGEVEEEELSKAVAARYPNLAGSQVRKLENDEILIRQISPADCIELCGGQQMIGKAKVQWQRIIWTAKVRENVSRLAIIDVRGMPATVRSKENMEAVVKAFGRLKGIITTGLESGDPNLTVLDVEMEKEEGMFRPVIVQSRKGMVTVKISERQPPAPPAIGDFGRTGGKSAGRRDEYVNGEEAMAACGGSLIVKGLGTEKRRESRDEKEEISRVSADLAVSREGSNIRKSRKSNGGERRRTSSQQTRLRGKRLVKGDIIRRHVWYERRKLFIKGDGGEKI